MKTCILVFFCGVILVNNIEGQKAQIEKIQNLKSDIIDIKSDYLDIKIQTWGNDYIEVQHDVMINLNSDDDNHELEIQNTSKGVTLVSTINTDNIEQMVIVTDKEGKKTYTPMRNWNDNIKGNDFNSLNMGYEIEGELTLFVPENMNLSISTTYGDVFIDGKYQGIKTCTTYGLIEAKLENVSEMKQVNFNSTYDIVDLTLDKNSDASLNLQTSYGSVFTDLPLQTKQTKSSNRNNGCSQFSEKYILNNGSVAIDIVATYDNIYVRSN